jgi:hypothetical protein
MLSAFSTGRRVTSGTAARIASIPN